MIKVTRHNVCNANAKANANLTDPRGQTVLASKQQFMNALPQ